MDIEQLIVIMTGPRAFLGRTDHSRKKLVSKLAAGEVVILRDAVEIQRATMVDRHRARVQGAPPIVSLNALSTPTTIDACQAPIPELYLVMGAFYRVADLPDGMIRSYAGAYSNLCGEGPLDAADGEALEDEDMPGVITL